MNCCGQAKQFYNRCCPAPVNQINVTQNYLVNTDEDVAYVVDTLSFYGTRSEKVVLPNPMYDVFTPKVYVNGVLQVKGLHYCILSNKKTIQFKFKLSGTDLVSVTYAYVVLNLEEEANG